MSVDSEQKEDQLAQKSIWSRFGWKRVFLLLGIAAVLVISIEIWLFDIDWESLIDKYGYPGIFILSFVNSMTVFFPLPGEVALFAAPQAMCSSWMDVFWVGVIAGIGSALGETTAYYAGLWGRFAIPEKHQKSYDRIEKWMRRYGGAAIFVFALTPLPFDVVGIVAGVLRFRLWKFLVFCWIGRFLRALVIVYGGWYGWGAVESLL